MTLGRTAFVVGSVLVVGMLPACLPTETTKVNKPSGSADAWSPGPPGSAVFDFEKECGIPKANQDDPTLPLVQGTYKSLPIVVEGSIIGVVSYRVVTAATVTINSNLLGTVQQQDITVLEATTQILGPASDSALTKEKAEKAAKANSGSSRSALLTNKDWFKLTNGNTAEYTDVLCAASGTSSIAITRNDGGNATVKFTPALISTVNPVAPVARMRFEFKTGRTFHVTADVQGTGNGAKAGTSQGTVTIREVAPTFTNMGTTVTAGIAWEIVNDFPGGAYTVGLSKRQVFYIDPATRSFAAIMDESDRPDATSGKALPPTYLIKSP